MSGGGGIIIIHGKRNNGTSQNDIQISLDDATAAITWLRTAASNNIGAKNTADALQAAVDFVNGG